MQNNQAHLTVVSNAIRIAWHTLDDVQAIKLNGQEMLFFNGSYIPLNSLYDHSPTQMVINYCNSNKEQQRKYRIYWKRLLIEADAKL